MSIRTKATMDYLCTELGSHSAEEVFKNSLEMWTFVSATNCIQLSVKLTLELHSSNIGFTV